MNDMTSLSASLPKTDSDNKPSAIDQQSNNTGSEVSNNIAEKLTESSSSSSSTANQKDEALLKGDEGHSSRKLNISTTNLPSNLNYSPVTTPVKKEVTKQLINVGGVSYTTDKVVGNGSFGVVIQASVVDTGEIVAIKKVLQDRRFKNRELQIMRLLSHPNIVQLRNSFYTNGDKADEVYLNLVMEYIPETVYRVARHYSKLRQPVPIICVKLHMYQLARSLAYIHSLGICHRDIKPQNLLLDPQSGVLKLCDFGSAKILVPGEPNVSYICSRYYRAPELIFGSTTYTTAIDIWSMGCVMAELLLGQPLFPGDSGVDQLVEIIKVLGTPAKDQIQAMNPNYTDFRFPQIKGHSWNKVFRNRTPPEAIDLISKLLQYTPLSRTKPFEGLTHPFFDELREPQTTLPSTKPLPLLFNFTTSELAASRRIPHDQLIPYHGLSQLPAGSEAALNTTINPPSDKPKSSTSESAADAPAIKKAESDDPKAEDAAKSEEDKAE
eukprot:TRINITY_DN2828_c0_g1_i1.p1 TRINITY_DN2828_c0_g1~~TRINITY_DN2828_c0_g1_i1.p1  ORF type:complete len:495 (+),score=179.86 TRINITY_DN2828_c0_g1_i1:144-1628(+)